VRRRERLAAAARLVVPAFLALMIILYAAGLVIGLGRLAESCAGAACHPAQLSPAEAALNSEIGLTLSFYAWFTTLTYALYGAIFFAVAGLIVWRRSDEPMALFIAFFLTAMGAGALPVLPVLGPLIFTFVGLSIFPLFALFPDGRFVPRWFRWLMPPWIVYALVQFLGAPPAGGVTAGPPGSVSQLAFLLGIGAQVYRYRRVSNPLQRQQTKWVVLGFSFWLVCLAAVILVLNLVPALRGGGVAEFFFDRYAFALVGLVPILAIPVSFGVAILRYRLWDIDILIRGALVYSVLTGVLALMYFAGVVLLQGVIGAMTGHGANAVAVVLTTLAVAALFSPLRRRIQARIDRRYYRRRYDAQKVLADFARTARDQVEVEALSAEVARVVQETMQPQVALIWLKPAERERPGTPVS
jgi:hypothetical protein